LFLLQIPLAYTHRIGRTGRAGEAGLATSFLTAEDTDIMYDLKQMLQKTNNYIPTELRDHPAAQYKPGE
jgi:ATP-dependent RNA helicase DDX23/PRP28